jgi:hypothetical protein
MGINRVRFQKGLSIAEFMMNFADPLQEPELVMDIIK